MQAKGWNAAQLARASGVAESRLSAWRRGGPPTVANARAIARALEEPLVTVLVEAGVLTRADVRQALATYHVHELTAEINRRFDAMTGCPVGDDVTQSTPELANPLALVADKPDTERLRDQLERAWTSDAELPDPPGPEDGA